MSERFYNRHYAACSKCGHEVSHSRSGTFITPFFLPELCAGCGQSFSRYSRPAHDETSPHWIHVIEKIECIPPVRTRNPLTWFRGPTYGVAETNKYPVY